MIFLSLASSSEGGKLTQLQVC